jgi:UDP-2-acetamido-2,6-beta-L-arabino-hexul-4-ose reductase
MEIHSDIRGELMEFFKAPGYGQIYVSRSRPGAVRANHYHERKTEKFLVVAGTAEIRTRPRSIDAGYCALRRITGNSLTVVEIPPGDVHSITNVGKDDMVLVVWSSEVFDPADPDTYAEEV